MCPDCEDFARTVVMLGQLALYAEAFGADESFIETVGPSLAASLPELPSGHEPSDGSDYPGEEPR